MIITFIQLLVALKVRYPQRITILRGNHESRQVFCLSPSYFDLFRLDFSSCHRAYI